MKTTSLKKGFTLIELLTVVSIIALLSTVVMSSLTTSREKARDVAKIQTMNEVKSALELFNTTKGYFPSTSDMPNSLTSETTKYIESVNAKIVYRGENNGSECSLQGAKCYSYHMGIALEREDNPALKIDKDSSVGFLGSSSDCSSSASSPEKCYDIQP
jgi:prepilin-type N-terminal cleavage/methylation domain-containing protein